MYFIHKSESLTTAYNYRKEKTMNQEDIERGAKTVVDQWIRLRDQERLCIVTSKQHYDECVLMKEAALSKHASAADILLVELEGIHVGDYFDQNPEVFDDYDVIIGASDYSIITTKAAERAISRGKRMLSLPLSTNNGESMLGFDFMMMDTDEARITAETAMGMIGQVNTIRIRTELGTDLTFSMKGRSYTFFNGTFWVRHPFSSASFEICMPIVENATNGTLVCDGSFGYIGKTEEPVHITLKDGRITEIEDNKEGRRLKEYFESYKDDRMYVAGELGIGLNEKSRCVGECYIEDESTYHTFHIGFGRNVGLGGKQKASGHFDLVTWDPDIWADGRLIMKHGDFVMPE